MVNEATAKQSPIVPTTLRSATACSRTHTASTRKASIISKAGYIHRKSRGTNFAAAE
jgi:hypothetical protein